ncbi:hypothetical protein N0Y54_34100 [Nostoc punctiforme UO1]|uniref:hypothetical protein n=1 Tax=Nostoc punctiforme TaxID=272131 RepID=UPI0030ACC9C4
MRDNQWLSFATLRRHTVITSNNPHRGNCVRWRTRPPSCDRLACGYYRVSLHGEDLGDWSGLQ